MEHSLIIGLAIAALLLSFIAIKYNQLIALSQTRNNAFADVDVQLKVRHDLIPNLVETVKKYTQHEKDVFENVAIARSNAMGAQNVSDKINAEAGLDQALMKLLATTENYPQLKADESFARLQTELSNIEKNIAAARRFFNNATAEYNTAIQQFPSNLIAAMCQFKQENFFTIDDNQRASVQVAF